MIQRRAFVGTLAVGLLSAPRLSLAQAPAKVPRVGWLGPQPLASAPNFKPFVEGLRELSYIPGQNVLVESRVLELGKHEQHPDIAAQLIGGGIDVILASNPYAIEAAAKATKTIPIVGVDLESDPVARGWVASLARPGGNVTGFFLELPEMSGKQLQFLREVKPELTRVAVLGDPRINELQFRATEAAARGGGLTLQRMPVTSLNEIPGAIAEAARQRSGALLALSSPLIFINIAEAAVKYRLPSICLFVPAFAEAGGLLAYGPDFPDLFRRAGGYVGRILKGAKPADLPVQRPTKFELAVNLKTARLLKLALPQSLVLRADRVIGE